jgi:hypothetical protein
MDGQLGQMRQQFPELQKSAQAAIDSATAAKANADTLINSERPWVIPEIRKRVRWGDSLSLEEETLGKPIKKRYVYFTFSVTNHGRTPAEIIAIRGNQRQSEAIQDSQRKELTEDLKTLPITGLNMFSCR